MDDEIRIDFYIRAILQRWWVIVLATALPAIIALVVNVYLIPPTYEAAAGVLIARTRSEVTFDPRFQTVDSNAPGNTAALAQQARRAALVSLVKNGAVAQDVVRELALGADSAQLHPADLMQHIRAGLAVEIAGPNSNNNSNSDLILISAQAGDPARAAELANLWAAAYEQHINQLYREQAASHTSILQQVNDVWATYDAAETALVDYMASGRLQKMELEISDLEKRIELASTDRAMLLDRYYNDRQGLVEMLENTRLLQQQIESGSENGTASNRLAILLLKAQVVNRPQTWFTKQNIPPGDVLLQMNLEQEPGDTSAQSQQKDVEALALALEVRIATLDAGIQSELAAPLPTDLVQMQADLSQLKAALEAETATHRELVRARDQAWDTYSALRVRADELSIETGMEDVQVRFASPALEPSTPVSPHIGQNVIMAAALGFLVSLIVVLAAATLQQQVTDA